MKTDFIEKKKKFQAYRQKYDQQQLRTIKLIAETVKKIVKNNDKRLSNEDIKDLCLRVYGKYDKIKHIRVRNSLAQELMQNKINTALIEFYSQAGLNKDEAIKMLNLAKDTAIEKKDVNNLLKIVEKFESASNLTGNNGVKATYKETTDFSKLGKDGQPEVKTTKTLEITKNEAISSLETDDLNKVDDNVSPINPD